MYKPLTYMLNVFEDAFHGEHQNNSQPLYAIVSPDEELLISPVSYLPDAKTYQMWLEKGLEVFEK